MESKEFVDEFNRIKSQHPHLFGVFATEARWDFFKDPSNFGPSWTANLSLYWILLRSLGLVTGPLRMRFFSPRTLFEGILTVRDVFRSILRGARDTVSRNRGLKIGEIASLLTQSATASMQFMALMAGLPAVIAWFLLVAKSDTAGSPMYVHVLWSLAVISGVWAVLLFALFVIGVIIGLAMTIFALVLGVSVSSLTYVIRVFGVGNGRPALSGSDETRIDHH